MYLKKPEYYFKPLNILKRLNKKAGAVQEIATAMGTEISADTGDLIGKSIYFTGTYDLCVMEALVRLVHRGDMVVDAGANIGFITQLASVRVKDNGMVLAFEPDAVIYGQLSANVNRLPIRNVQLFNVGLGSKSETVFLNKPAILNNLGSTFLSKQEQPHSIPIIIQPLDKWLLPSKRKIALCKIDVEGFELEVLKGMDGTLDEKLVENIVLEDFNPYPSSCCQLLLQKGYTIFWLELGWLMPLLADPESEPKIRPYDTVNYLATLNPTVVKNAYSKMGYRSLNKQPQF